MITMENTPQQTIASTGLDSSHDAPTLTPPAYQPQAASVSASLALHWPLLHLRGNVSVTVTVTGP